jgi:hypothetical protein
MNALLELAGKGLCILDVLILRRLVSASEHHDQHRATLNEINAVARAVVDAKLAKSAPDWLHVAGIAEGETPNAGSDPCDGLAVAETSQPSAEGLRLADLDHR